MSLPAERLDGDLPQRAAIEDDDFPILEISQIAEQESWRKEINRPAYHIHKWWATPEGETIPLFDRYVFAQDAYPKKKPRAQIVCPSCFGITEGRYDATDMTCESCRHRFDPQRGPASGQYVTTKSKARYRIKDLIPTGAPPQHRLYAMLALRPNGEKVYLSAREQDLLLVDEAEKRLATENLPLPTLHVRPGHNTDQARGYNYLRWRDFFNARQLLCLGLLLRAILRIENQTIQEQLLCLFSSTLEFNNLFCSYKGEGTGAVRHMFSNHILKPERTPLENSVWGTDRSSGTFRSLFESRLLRAKRYLSSPFEIALHGDLLGASNASHKVIASRPMRPSHAASWSELVARDEGVLILNGDSAALPLPDRSVDAVITDPPYFDFVHYSELSDFFFAWLAPVLKHRHPWFDKADSSDVGEVQQQDPRVFARQLSHVLVECRRVLKDDGVLAFSFHHSRPEGWAAIHEAVSTAGLCVVAAHPVHGELRAASPKNAAKDPISLDTILVCRKRDDGVEQRISRLDVLERADELAARLAAAGMALSNADRFVIAASQALVAASDTQSPFDAIRTLLEQLRLEVSAAANRIPAATARALVTTDAGL